MPWCDEKRQPVIKASDLAEVTMLLGVFDEITFNSNGEMVARLTETFPMLGPVLVSLFVPENHLAVYRGGDADNDTKLWSGQLHELDHDWEPGKLDRDILMMHV